MFPFIDIRARAVSDSVYIIHAGQVGAPNNPRDDPKKKAAFRARNGCDGPDPPKPGTPKHLACEKLWPKGKHNIRIIK